MAAKAGRSFLLKILSGTTFTSVGGFRANNIELNEEAVDVTDKDSANRWQEFERFGLRSWKADGAGVLKDSTGEKLLRDNFESTADTKGSYQVTIPGFATITGEAIITSLKYLGPHNEAVAYEVALQGAGAATVVDIV